MQTVFLPILTILSVVAAHFLPIQPRVATESDDMTYRLSGSAVPDEYLIQLKFPEEIFKTGSLNFSGTSTITFHMTEESSEIELHSPTGTPEVVVQSADSNTPIGNKVEWNPTTSILKLSLEEALVTDKSYQLVVTYSTKLETTSMIGAYLSTYNDGDEVKYMVTTQFEPSHARKAFPCFDEPQYKAKFKFEITYPKGMTALSNTPAVTDGEDDDVFNIAKFEETPYMSTYLTAFVVSDFSCSASNDIETGVEHRVCSRTSASGDTAYANEWGPKLINALEKLTGVKYSQSVKKMHQIAIPDFYFGAMENWGLVTYRESGLLRNSVESTVSNDKYIITIIAHEFAHQWFGNLVTTKWWNTIFLNEGLASYFEHLAAASIEELGGWELMRQILLDKVHSVLLIDGLSSSLALTSQASTSTEIMDKFGTVSYNKGASLIRMIHSILGDNAFKSGINKYLTTNEYQPVQPSNIWAGFQGVITAELFPDTLERVMENWIDKPGYPVVTVSVSGKDVTLSQERFLYDESEDATQWYVPITYTVGSDENGFEDTVPKAWLVPSEDKKLTDVLPDDDWIIVNNLESGYYRVHYDATLRNRIKTALTSDHTKIHVLNRAQIVDDAINLARAGYLSYHEAFDILSYLKSETEYYPIYASFIGLDYLRTTYGLNSDITKAINKLQLELLEGVRKEVSFELTDDNHVRVLRDTAVLARLCRMEEASCVKEAQSKFAAFKSGTRFDNNLKSIVYCTALRHSSDETDWYFLWERFQTVDVATEQVIILASLGCTKNKNLLEYYLQQSLSATSGIRWHDISRVWSSVVTSNDEGVDIAIDFYRNNYKEIIDYYSGALTVLSTAAGRVTTQAQVKKLEAFASTADLVESVKSVAEGAVKTAKANIEWASKREATLKEHFGIGSGNNVKMGMMFVFVSLLTTVFLR